MNAGSRVHKRVTPPIRRRPRGGAQDYRALWPLIILIYSTLLPMEIRFTFVEQTFYPPRIASILILPWVLNRLSRQRFDFSLPDLLVLLGTAWMVASFMAVYDFATGLTRGGALAFDILAAYLIARVSITSTDDFRRILIVVIPGFAAAAFILALESLTHTQLLRPAAASIFGPLPSFQEGQAIGEAAWITEVRMGLYRASGPFSHPILAGVVMASLIGLVYGSGLRKWPYFIGLGAGFCAIFTVSSGAALMLVLLVAMIAMDEGQKRVPFINWKLILLGLVLVGAFLELASQGGLIRFIIRNSFNPSSGYYRTLIWDYGTQSVMNHPLFGIGFAGYEREAWMGTSVDHYFLMLAIRHGVVPPFAFLAAFITILFKLAARAATAGWVDRRLYFGLQITLVALTFVGMTVSFFGGAQAWVWLLVGSMASLANKPARAVSRQPMRQARAPMMRPPSPKGAM